MDQAQMQMAASALKSAKKPAQKAKLRMTIKPTDNDRFVVDHDSMGGMTEPMQPPMQHSFNDVDELVEHVKKSYGGKKESGKEAAKEAKEEKKESPAEKKAEAAAAEKA